MNNFTEPCYDDVQLAQFQEQQTSQLIDELVDCIIHLRNTVTGLRTEVNALTGKLNPDAPPACYEIYSDLCKSFEDHPCFSRFEEQLARLIYE